MNKVINNAELLFYLEQMGVGELMNIYENREEVEQFCNKIGRPDLFKSCIKEIEENTVDTFDKLVLELKDPDYETDSETDSECSETDLVEEEYTINPSNNGFCELLDVTLSN